MADAGEGGAGEGEVKRKASRADNNFLRQFRDTQSRQFRQFTASQFMEVWNHYDLDGKKQTQWP